MQTSIDDFFENEEHMKIVYYLYMIVKICNL
jgi:hypothetical protein